MQAKTFMCESEKPLKRSFPSNRHAVEEPQANFVGGFTTTKNETTEL